MNTTAQTISYKQTGAFSKIVTDYIAGNNLLTPFYKHPFTIDGIKASIEARKKYPTNRQALVDVLQKQYAAVETSAKVKANIDLLLLQNTFTITTAHQPNIFTGQLYFIYKILHAVKIADYLKKELPENNFVPVYYMGSEDADLDELGHIFINGQKHQWQTKQTGAVGRMVVDKNLINLISNIAGQVAIFPFGNAVIATLKACYKEGETIEAATFNVVNHFFKTYGVLVVLPDNADLKRLFAPVIEKELTETFSHQQVATTVTALPAEYKVQASGRALNLFYLKDNRRDRIEWNADKFRVTDTSISFTKEEVLQELKNNPERFSPNVILRPVFQETILPNIAFIGGGGEVAYWLELKKVFETVDVPYPVIVLRNSFLIMEQDVVQLADKLNLIITDLFKNEQDLINKLVKQETTQQLSLQKEQQAITTVYATIKTIVDAIDVTLAKHTEALKVQTLKKITNLEKKMLRAERKKFEAQQRKIHKLKTALFPTGNLQERIENFIPFYAKWGDDFIDTLYQHSLTLQQEFVVLRQD